MHWTLGILPHLQSFFWLRVFSAPKQSPRLPQRKSTQTVGRVCRTYGEHFSSFEFSLLPGRVHACPSESPRKRLGESAAPTANIFLASSLYCFQAESTPTSESPRKGLAGFTQNIVLQYKRQGIIQNA